MSTKALWAAIGVVCLFGWQSISVAQTPEYLEATSPPGPTALSGDIADCVPHPIVGTVPYLNAFEAQKTNAQLFGTVGFFERVMQEPGNLRLALAEDLDLEEDFPDNPLWAWETNVIANALRIPSVNLGSGCGRSQRYSMQSMDLYAANSALRIPLWFFDFAGESSFVSLFYAGGVTANVIENSNRFFQSYKFSAIGLLGTYAPPAVLAFQEDGDFQQVTGDFIVGGEGNFGSYGNLYLGYVWSSGIYTNLTLSKIKFFTSVLLKDELNNIPLVQSGFRAIEVIKGIGNSSIWGRRQQLATGASVQNDNDASDLRLTTGNFAHREIPLGDVALMDVSAEYAFEPDLFLHKVSGSIYTADFKKSMFGFRLDVGTIDFPEAPYLGVNGGRRWSVIADFGILRVGYNDPNLFDAFPYARDFVNVNTKFAF